MKTSNKFLILLLIATFTFTGCRREGDDGDIYLSIIGYSDTVTYTDDNDNVPDTPYSYSTYGPCREGSYNFIYTHNVFSSGSWTIQTVTGSYYIYANKGKKGGLFIPGNDGEDRYFELHLENGGYIVRTGYPSNYNPLEQTEETQTFERTQDFGNYTVQVKGKIETTKSSTLLESASN